MTLDTDQTVTGYKQFMRAIQADQFIKTNGTTNQLLLANGGTADVDDFLPKHYPHAMEQMIIEPDSDIRNQGPQDWDVLRMYFQPLPLVLLKQSLFLSLCTYSCCNVSWV
ncbi:MAG: hypothetical protein EZS28_052496 [Streblomastix strix]|uniref:Uncharacterized protein n=1 Tax=Streblomastix strix TaxID=222440 RepID=A0A5J4S6I1_9EUKA|nr:MAG: hypothetical protein EZS28_052496 [Streblomastix strix]